MVNITDSMISQVNIFCIERFSCDGGIISIKSEYEMNVSISCQSTFACPDMNIIFENNIMVNISCYYDNSCENMLINTDNSEKLVIKMNMYRYSKDILFNHYYWSNIRVNCGYDLDKRYIRYNTYQLLDPDEILQLAQDEYPSSNKLPCEDIKIDCTGNNTDFQRECQYQYQLSEDKINLFEILQDDDRPSCYWLDIGQLFIASCQGTCDDDRKYNQFNVTFDLDLVLSFDDLETNTTTRSYRVCQRYFGIINDTEDSLSSIDAVFYDVLQIISGPGQLVHDIIISPQSELSDSSNNYIKCLNEDENIIQITTNLTIDSVSDNQNEIDNVFNPNSDFISKSEELLSALFGIPVTFKEVTLIDDTITNQGFGWISIVISVISGIVLVIILVWIIRYYHQKRKTIQVKNPMVICIGIGFYDREIRTKDKEYKGYADDLDSGIRKDIDNAISLFVNVFKYDIFPRMYENQDIDNYKAFWEKKELIKFLEARSFDLDQLSYDGLIVLISCHGIDEKILTSDYGLISKTDIHRIFSKSGKSRDIPRMFIFDCCSGIKERETETRYQMERISDNEDVSSSSSEEEEEEMDASMTSSSMDKIKEIGKTANINITRAKTVAWAYDESNPDHKLILINAANPGFQSKLDTERGSYAMTKIMDKLRDNVLNNNNGKFLYKITDEVQSELHDIEKKQLITCTYNQARYVKFVIRNDSWQCNQTEFRMTEIVESNSKAKIEYEYTAMIDKIEDDGEEMEIVDLNKDNDNDNDMLETTDFMKRVKNILENPEDGINPIIHHLIQQKEIEATP